MKMKVRIIFTDGSKLDTIIDYICLGYEDEVPVLVIYPKGEKPTAVPFELICQLRFI